MPGYAMLKATGTTIYVGYKSDLWIYFMELLVCQKEGIYGFFPPRILI